MVRDWIDAVIGVILALLCAVILSGILGLVYIVITEG